MGNYSYCLQRLQEQPCVLLQHPRAWQPGKARRLHNARGWHMSHVFGEGKAQKHYPSTSREKNAQGCDPELWEKGCRASLVIPLPQVMLVGMWVWYPALGKQLGCMVLVDHVLGSCFAEVPLPYVWLQEMAWRWCWNSWSLQRRTR